MDNIGREMKILERSERNAKNQSSGNKIKRMPFFDGLTIVE